MPRLHAPHSPLSAFPIDWGSLAPLRLKARAIAEGVYAGMHRSLRKGAGVEFGGHRPYVPGDDLRFFDRRALLRHDRMMIRVFETETDRALWLCLDATASMAYRSGRAPGAKLAYAATLAAALARVAVSTGDPVGLEWIGGQAARSLSATAGREAFDRIVGSLEGVAAAGDLTADATALDRCLAPVARKARRGASIVLFSDLYDLPAGSLQSFGALSIGGRALIVVQVLDPAEVDLDFKGQVRLRAMEGSSVVETDADLVREQYRARLDAITTRWTEEITARGGRVVKACTTDPPVEIVRSIVQAIAEAHR